MLDRRFKLLLFVLFFLPVLSIGHLVLAQGASQHDPAPPVVLLDTAQEYSVAGSLDVLEEVSGQLTLQDVMSPAYANQFQPNRAEMLRLGLNGDTDWFRLRVQNASGRNVWLLQIQDARVPYVDVYREGTASSDYVVTQTGDYLPFGTREIPDRTFLFRLTIPRETAQTVYVRVRSSTAVDVPMSILSPEALAQHNNVDLLTFGMFYGAMVIMAGYNLFVFLSLRDRTYLYLTLVILGLALSKAAQDGLGHEYLWAPFSNRWTTEYSILFTMLATSFFTTTFLELEKRAARTNRVFVVWRALALGVALLVPFINLMVLVTALLGVEVVLILGAVWRAWRDGYRPARAFLATWLLPLLTGLIYVLYYFGVLPNSVFTSNILLAFLAALALLWSFVLADRIKTLRSETQSAVRNLARSERQYRTLFQDSHDAVFITTRAGEIVDLNPAGQSLFRYARSELAHLHMRDLFQAARDYETFEQRLEAQGYVADLEVPMRCRDNSQVTVLISSTLWHDEERAISGYQGILRDVTERRHNQRELATYRLNLEELVAARTTQARAELAERRRAEGALEHRIQELFALNEIAKTISTVTDLTPALNTVAERVTHLFGITSTAIGEMDHAGRCMRVLAGYPPAPDTLSLVDRTFAWDTMPILHKVLESSQPLVFADPQRDERLTGTAHELMEQFGVTYLVLVPLRAGGIVNGVLLLQSLEPEPFVSDEVLALAETIAGTIATAIENARLYQQAQATAIADERRRLARELHDSVTQLLYSIVLLAEGWKTETEESDLDRKQVGGYFSELGDLGQQALGEMRLLLYQLRSPVLSEIGLSGALLQRLKAVEERVGIQTHLQANGNLDTLPLHVQAELYFIAQEALNNALRHAHASAIHVQLEKQNQQLELVIRDNGSGFDSTVISEGMGLRNMLARAQLLGAQIQVLSEQGQGTRVQLHMALDLQALRV